MTNSRSPRFGRGFDLILAVPVMLYFLLSLALLLSVFLLTDLGKVAPVFQQSGILFAIKTSFWTSAVSTFLSVAFAVPTGYLLSRYRFPGRILVDTILDMPIVMPPVVLGLSILVFFRTSIGSYINENLIEFVFTWKGILLAQFIVGCSLAVRIMKSGFDGMDNSLEEVAMTLGANRRQTFFKVLLPATRGHLVASTVVGWARIFGLFGPVLMVCGTMEGKTEIMPTSIFLMLSVGELDGAMTIAALMMIISLTTLVLFKRFGGQETTW